MRGASRPGGVAASAAGAAKILGAPGGGAEGA